MREILFKGKRFSNGEWVIGGIVKIFHPNYHRENEEEFLSQSPNCYCICANNKDYFVEQASIGQYTGLTDKNGKKIFEGDIIKHHRELWGKDDSDIGVVFWNEEKCMFLRTSTVDDENAEIWRDTEKHYEVIGNIHDNPELLRTPQNDEVRE